MEITGLRADHSVDRFTSPARGAGAETAVGGRNQSLLDPAIKGAMGDAEHLADIGAT
jgi:hypothetical protein